MDTEFWQVEGGDKAALERKVEMAKARGLVVMVHHHRFSEPCVLTCYKDIVLERLRVKTDQIGGDFEAGVMYAFDEVFGVFGDVLLG